MIFTPIGADPNLWGSVNRMRSEHDRYQLEINTMIFRGHRYCLCAVRNGEPDMGYLVNYCAGPEPQWQALFGMIFLRALEKIEESASPDEIEALLPDQRFKPIDNDPLCWAYLCQMAGCADLVRLAQPQKTLFIEEDYWSSIPTCVGPSRGLRLQSEYREAVNVIAAQHKQQQLAAFGV